MPVCRCHSFDFLETPIVSHAEVSELVTLSAVEVIPLAIERTDRERQTAHDKLMKMQEEFLRRISERLQGYERVLHARWRESERSQKTVEDKHAKPSAKVDQKKNTVTISRKDYNLLRDFRS